MDSSQPKSSRKTERKIVEKNRRNQMKCLYSMLISLLPNQDSKESISLLDRIDEATNYITTLKKNLEMANEKKESLMGRKRSYVSISEAVAGPSRSPNMNIRILGSSLEVVLSIGIDSQFSFDDVVRILHEENVDIVNASFQMIGNSIFQVFHARIPETANTFVEGRITDKLNKLMNGPTIEVEKELEPWDFLQIWNF